MMFILVPLALFAQVEIDTVIRLPVRLGQAFFIPEFNRLYTMPGHGGNLLVLDCSTYALHAKIPIGAAGAYTRFSWNAGKQKLYVVTRPPVDSTLVIDVAADSVIRSLKVTHEWYNDVYLSDIDVRFKPVEDSLYGYECVADTVTRRHPVHSTFASWDSVGRKLYVGQGSMEKLYVYDYVNDSCLDVVDVSPIHALTPDAVVFSKTHRRGYVSSFQWEMMEPANMGILDTEHDTLLRVLPVRMEKGLFCQIAIDERDGKAYIADCDQSYDGPDTMWVVDCATDSVLKKFECVHKGNIDMCMRWVPWSNRIYVANMGPDRIHKSSLVVIDCSTDSVIVPGMLLNAGYIRDIQLDPIRQRIFVIGVDSTDIYVLRDVQGGVAEESASSGPAPGLRVQMMPGGFDLSYAVAAFCRVDLSIYDQMGRQIRQLVGEEQAAGQHRATWKCRDSSGSRVPAGVYFVRLRTPAVTEERKIVVAR